MQANRVTITITDAQKDIINRAKNDLATATGDLETVVSKEEIKSLAKLGDARIPFVEKVAQYAVSNPEFLQPFADIAEFNQDFKAFTDLREPRAPVPPDYRQSRKLDAGQRQRSV